jgi:hypothetical protein
LEACPAGPQEIIWFWFAWEPRPVSCEGWSAETLDAHATGVDARRSRSSPKWRRPQPRLDHDRICEGTAERLTKADKRVRIRSYLLLGDMTRVNVMRHESRLEPCRGRAGLNAGQIEGRFPGAGSHRLSTTLFRTARSRAHFSARHQNRLWAAGESPAMTLGTHHLAMHSRPSTGKTDVRSQGSPGTAMSSLRGAAFPTQEV